ncbi:hypothetical protein Hdeb2414_s0009g00301271 [Helianthus debilis subsp. tardiflorus]
MLLDIELLNQRWAICRLYQTGIYLFSKMYEEMLNMSMVRMLLSIFKIQYADEVVYTISQYRRSADIVLATEVDVFVSAPYLIRSIHMEVCQYVVMDQIAYGMVTA